MEKYKYINKNTGELKENLWECVKNELIMFFRYHYPINFGWVRYTSDFKI